MTRRERLCAWGNCEKTTAVITINYRGQERPAFCCIPHAIDWLQDRQDKMLTPLPKGELEHIIKASQR
jgi:hypothetical protein